MQATDIETTRALEEKFDPEHPANEQTVAAFPCAARKSHCGVPAGAFAGLGATGRALAGAGVLPIGAQA